MKKNRVYSILKLVGLFLLTSACIFGYSNVDSKEIVEKEYRIVGGHLFQSQPILEEEEQVVPVEVVEEVKETPKEIQPVAVPVVATAQPVISGDSIRVADLYNHLMKDTTGEHFYLNHNLNGEYDGIGVPYIDFRTDFTGRKTILYSHSTPSGIGPFQSLQNYHNNPGYYWSHPMITIQYQGNTYRYQIFSVYVSLADSEESEGLEFYHQMDYTDEEWAKRIQEYKAKSEYETGVQVSGDDKIIILQTCSMDPNYYQKYYRYNLLIMGKLV